MRDGKIEIQYNTSNGTHTHLVSPTTRKLDLSRKNIESIKLGTIHKKMNIKHIDLSGNELKKIDLYPICRIHAIYKLNLLDNPFNYLDITPLLFCDRMYEFNVDAAIQCFVSPLALYTRAPTMFIRNWDSLGLTKRFDSMVDSIGWRSTLRKMKSLLQGIHPRHWFAAQRGLLVGLGMKEIAAYDGNPVNLLRGVKSSDSFTDAKWKIHENGIRLIIEQVENGGSTHFLDIDELAMTRAALVIPKLVAARRREINELTIELVNGETDARTIWFTYYGRRIMHDLGYIPYETNEIRLKDIVAGLERAGFSPKIVEKKRASRKQNWQRVSEGLSDHLELMALGLNLVVQGITAKPWVLRPK